MKHIDLKSIITGDGASPLPWWLSALRYVVGGICAVAVVGAFCWLWFIKLDKDLPKTARLKKQNDAWQARMGVVRHKLDVYDAAVDEIQARNNEVYRSIFALEPILDTAYVDSSATDMQALDRRITYVQERLDRQMRALEDVEVVAKKAGDMVSCIPAVPPVLPKKGSYHLSSPFGVRSDPVNGTATMHHGQDIASKIGNPVYATGDGTVEKVDFKYSGYGNEVVIDHGFGYKTRYAHLSSIDVGVGQALHRGDKIGEVGKSGRSTGPHLHYEVSYKGQTVNPMNYMDMTMPVGEYQEMIDKRRKESDNGKRPDSSSIGERQRKQGTSGRQ